MHRNASNGGLFIPYSPFGFHIAPRFYFDSADATATATGEGSDTGATTPGSEDPAASEQPPEDTSAETGLTSRQLAIRLEKAKAAERNAVLKELGLDSVDSAKEALKKAKELEDAQLSEAERLKKQADELANENATLKEVLQRTRETQEAAKAEQALKSIAEGTGLDPEYWDAIKPKVQKYIEDNFADEDDVTADALKDFYADLRKKKPALFVADVKPASSGPKTPEPKAPKATSRITEPPKPVKDMTPAEFEAYCRSNNW